MKIKFKNSAVRHILLIALVALTFAFIAQAQAASVQVKQKVFSSAEEAVKALVAALKINDGKELLAIFGPAGEEVLYSGDPVSDRERRQRFLEKYEEKNSLISRKDSVILILGQDEWPFPIPVVKMGKKWSFDTAAGKEEILNRRIGENELDAIETCLAIVDAQREYAMMDVDRDGILEYAEKIMSDPGKKNGLYWETKEGGEASPIGPLLAEARKEGYGEKQATDTPAPYHGYYYRFLKGQGKNAAGGAYEYNVNGRLFGGFALVAYPAAYGNSGVMTFIVNHDGIVYQKDLGKDTAKSAEAMNKFDPDKTWKKVK